MVPLLRPARYIDHLLGTRSASFPLDGSNPYEVTSCVTMPLLAKCGTFNVARGRALFPFLGNVQISKSSPTITCNTANCFSGTDSPWWVLLHPFSRVAPATRLLVLLGRPTVARDQPLYVFAWRPHPAVQEEPERRIDPRLTDADRQQQVRARVGRADCTLRGVIQQQRHCMFVYSMVSSAVRFRVDVAKDFAVKVSSACCATPVRTHVVLLLLVINLTIAAAGTFHTLVRAPQVVPHCRAAT